MKLIHLAKGKVAKVSDEDYEWLNSMSWHCSNKGYARHGNYDKVTKKTKSVYMHRLIMGEPKGLQIDHIDGDKLNNQRENLRIVTQSKNSLNTKVREGKTSSKYVGVFFNKQNSKWTSSIGVDYKQIYLGLFDTEEEAYKARVKKLSELGLVEYVRREGAKS
jgi:hypothetical protein